MDSNEQTNDSNSEMDLVNFEDSNSIESYFRETPAQIEKHLEFVTSNKSGHVLLGSSNLTGRYWCGSVWYYTDPLLAPDIESSCAALEFTGGVTDCAFINDNRAIIGQDGGLIDFILIKEQDSCFQIERTEQIEDHGYSVLSVKCTCDSKKAITASMDMGIRLWDCHTTACTHNFTPAHTQEVTSVASHPNHPEIFLSSSLDGNVFLWDIRTPRPASCVYRDLDSIPTAVSWVASSVADFPHVVVGTANGELHVRDSSIISYSLSSLQPFKRAIYRITPSRFRFNEFVACANETRVQAFSVEDEKITLRYCDDSHNDFVRGLEWLNETLVISCGWDKNVIHHTVQCNS